MVYVLKQPLKKRIRPIHSVLIWIPSKPSPKWIKPFLKLNKENKNLLKLKERTRKPSQKASRKPTK